ncbi:MAG: 6-carboxytetrahydropterin synthase QueD [Asgard group archaeon]|nr:6-carboxytetrahydropterin synthase QueD [Asgard group archaeon]
MYRISKEFSFSMGHRLSCHNGLCKNFHGHNYTIVVGVKSIGLNPDGMVMDFSDLKNIVQNYLKQFDHALMVNEMDRPLIADMRKILPGLKVTVVPFDPTAENMAREIYEYVQEEISKYVNDVEMDFVTVYETETSQATYSED